MKRKLTNVRSHIEDEIMFLETLISEKHFILPPIYKKWAQTQNLIAKAILCIHKNKKTRKDIYIEKC